MEAFAALALIATLIITSIVGARLLMVARRTRELPELLFGIGFLGGGLGEALGQLGKGYLWVTPGTLATTMNALLFGLVVAATIALYLVVWPVFEKGNFRGVVTFALGSSALVIAYALKILSGEFAGEADKNKAHFSSQVR